MSRASTSTRRRPPAPPEVAFAVRDAGDPPPGPFDVVAAVQLLSHLTDPVPVLRTAARVGGAAPESKTSDYRAMVAEVRGECPELREVLFLGYPQWPS